MGPRKYAIEQSRTVARAGASDVAYLLWIDGVLTPQQLLALKQEKAFIVGHQHETYYIAKLAHYVDGMRLRGYLDPNIFILQADRACTMLELNFNPTQAQLDLLRRVKKTLAALTVIPIALT